MLIMQGIHYALTGKRKQQQNTTQEDLTKMFESGMIGRRPRG